MKVLQSTLEKGLYILLLLMFAVNVVTLYSVEKSTRTVIANQKTNSSAVKEYIACLIGINPQGTAAQIKADELVCFDNAPNVK